MNNKIKIIIAIGIIGIVIMVAGFVMGSGPSSIPAIFSEATIPEGAVPIGDVQTTDVRSIELNLFASKISIKSGENFDLSGSGQYDGYVICRRNPVQENCQCVWLKIQRSIQMGLRLW